MNISVTDVVAVVGAPIALYQLWQVRRGNQGTYEQHFVDRYWQIDDDRVLEREEEVPSRQRYFRLCEDQFEMMRLGRISWRTWQMWHDGIMFQLLQLDRDGQALPEDGLMFTKRCHAELITKGNHDGVSCPAIFGQAVTKGRARISVGRGWVRLRDKRYF